MMVRRLKNRAVYPGTFDPVTNGHISLIERACGLFDEVIIAVAESGGKEPLFTFEDRIEAMRDTVAGLGELRRLKVVGFHGLTADLARKLKARAIVRGVRAVSDFEYEFQMALMNRKMAREIETVFLMPALSWVYLSSSLVKDVARNGGDVSGLVPTVVKKALVRKFKTNG